MGINGFNPFSFDRYENDKYKRSQSILYNIVPPPQIGAFSWINQSTATVSRYRDVIFLSNASSSNQNNLLFMPIPAAPYKLTIGFSLNMFGVTNECGGICLRQSSDGKQVSFHVIYVSTSPNGRNLSNTKWSAHSTWAAAYKDSGRGLALSNPIFLRLLDDGTNRNYMTSSDGYNFMTWNTNGRTDYMTADQIGFFIGMNGTGSGVGMSLFHWKLERGY